MRDRLGRGRRDRRKRGRRQRGRPDAARLALVLVTGVVVGAGSFGATGPSRLWLRAALAICAFVLASGFAFLLTVAFSPH